MPATLADVARRAGVSEATASRVLNGRRHVSLAARTRVEAAALALEYVPNRAARDLSLARSSTVAFLVHHAQYPPRGEASFATRVLHGATRRLRAHGFDLLYGVLDEDEARDVVRLPAARGDGALLLGPAFPAAAILALVDDGRIVVLVDNLVASHQVDAVLADNHAAAVAVTEHLLQWHRYARVACIAGPEHWPSTAERVAGYREALAARGLSPTVVHATETTVRDGVEATDRLLAAAAPQAIVAVNDAMAVGVLHRLRQRPRGPRIAVVGFDDSTWAQLTDPPLTTVAIDAERMGAIAAERLVERLREGTPTESRVLRIPTALRIRRSCGCTGDEKSIEARMEGAAMPESSARPGGRATVRDASGVGRGEEQHAN